MKNKIFFEGEMIDIIENKKMKGYTLKINGVTPEGHDCIVKFLIRNKNLVFKYLTKEKYSHITVQGHLESITIENNGRFDRNKIYLIGDEINDL